MCVCRICVFLLDDIQSVTSYVCVFVFVSLWVCECVCASYLFLCVHTRAERLIAFAIKSRYVKTRFSNRNVRDYNVVYIIYFF